MLSSEIKILPVSEKALSKTQIDAVLGVRSIGDAVIKHMWQSRHSHSYVAEMTVHTSALDLRSFFSTEWLELYENYLPTARAWWDRNTTTKSEFGVEQTTARAYSTGRRGAAGGPVAVFNEWAAYQVQALDKDPKWRQTLATRAGFNRAHAGFAASLSAHWFERVASTSSAQGPYGPGARVKRVSRSLTVGQKYKLVDLFVRHLWIKRSDRTLNADANLSHARLPLDRKSLHVLSATFGGILMAPKFSMGMVVSEAQYRYCQTLVEMVCLERGGTPLLFDVFAWHHPRAQELYAAGS